jgi:class 3 adenylate cyclase
MDEQPSAPQPDAPSKLDAAKLQALLDGVDRLTSSLTLDDVLGHLLAIGQKLTSSQAGSVILYDGERKDLYFAAATGPTAETVKNIRIPPGTGKAGTVYTSRLSLVENDLKDHYKGVDEKTHFVTHSMICVPLIFGDVCYGVLQLLNKENAGEPQSYERPDLELTQRLASQATIALRNAILFDRMLASSGLYASPEHRRELIPLVTRDDPEPLVEQATIVFADMRGFTKLCAALNNNPTHIQSRLKDFFKMLADAVLAHGGIVNKFLGDGLLAMFRGADAPARAVQCAFAMHERFGPLRDQWQTKIVRDIRMLDLGIGIATDEVTIGVIGDDKVRDFTIIGDAVNRASALEKIARNGKRTLCDVLTYNAVRQLVMEVTTPESVELVGTGQGFWAYDLRGARSAVKFFICHSHDDIARIRASIVPLLEKYGFEAFLAEHAIRMGAEWVKIIRTAIETADHFLIVLTEHSLKSAEVSDEIYHAFKQEAAKGADWILPVLLDKAVDPSQLHLRLPQRQYEDLSTPEGLARFDAFLRDRSNGGSSQLRKAGA